MNESYYIGDIASEAYGYVHLVGKPAIIKKVHALLPLACVDVPGESLSIWISKADLMPVGASCTITDTTVL